MKNTLKIVIAAFTCFSLAGCLAKGKPQEASLKAESLTHTFAYKKVTFRAVTADGEPIRGLHWGFNAVGSELTVVDWSGFFPMPTFPHFDDNVVDTGTFGYTNQNGTSEVAKVKIAKRRLNGVNKELKVYSYGRIAVCDPGSFKQEVVELPDWEMNQRSCELIIDRQQNRNLDALHLECRTSLTHAELQDEIANVRNQRCE